MLVSCAFAASAAAQDAPPPDPKIDAMIAQQKQAFGIPRAKVTRGCGTGSGDEIVVCADHGEDQRLPDDGSNTNDGVPRAPDFAPRNGSVVMRGCFLQKCPKEVYMIDLDAIPEAPEGSDADMIGKGEKRY